MTDRYFEVQGTRVWLADPVDPDELLDGEVIGRDRELHIILTAWTACRGHAPREGQAPLLIGAAGSGKNTLVYEVARLTGRELYILNGHEALHSSDLMLAPIPPKDRKHGRIEFKASALLTAMVRGGIGFIDEIGKLRPAALAPLAPLLDGRRYLDDNTLLLTHFRGHPDFRLIAATNPEDMWNERFDQYLRGRLRPEIELGPASADQIGSVIADQFALDTHRDAGLIDCWWQLWHAHRKDSLPVPRDVVAVFATAERLAAREHLASNGACYSLALDEPVVIEPRHLECSFEALIAAREEPER